MDELETGTADGTATDVPPPSATSLSGGFTRMRSKSFESSFMAAIMLAAPRSGKARWRRGGC